MNDIIEWRKITEMINNARGVHEYTSLIHNIIVKGFYTIFGKSNVLIEDNKIANTYYDYIIELRDLKLFCEVKYEKEPLKYYWDDQISEISNHIVKVNKNKNRVKKVKYLLILVSSRDSLEKMGLHPIKSNVMVINLQKIIDMQNFLYTHKEKKENLYLLFKNSNGVLYDSFIDNYLEICMEISLTNYYDLFNNLVYDRNILNINLENIKKFFQKKKNKFNNHYKKFLEQLYETNGELSINNFVKNLNLFKYEKDELIELQNKLESLEIINPDLERKIELISKTKENLTVFNLVFDYNYDYIEIKPVVNNYNRSRNNLIIREYPSKDFEHCIINIPFLKNDLIFRTYKQYLQELLSNLNFELTKDDYLFNKNKRMISILDISTMDPELFFNLGSEKSDSNFLILTINKDLKIPNFLFSFKVFKYEFKDNKIMFDDDFKNEVLRKCNLLRFKRY